MELRSHLREARVMVGGATIGSSKCNNNCKHSHHHHHHHRRRTIRPPMSPFAAIIHLLIVMNLLFTSWRAGIGPNLIQTVEAVSVQTLNVPDLVVIDQLNQQQQPSRTAAGDHHRQTTQNVHLNTQSQPEAASLINSQDLSSSEQQITFECLISFDKRKDKNLVVKWHHDDRIEPIYQWIPELNKRSIAPQYRSYIAPIVSTAQPNTHTQQLAPMAATDTTQWAATALNGSNGGNAQNGSQNSIQLLEAGFRLVRPSKELGGKYTCSAISSQNDDSKWKKMIVYTPPRSFRFNASRTDIGALLASQRERLIQPSMIGPASGTFPMTSSSSNQLPLAYRMRGFDGNQQQQQLLLSSQTTISPQMYSTIDYVNVNQQRTRQSASSSPWLIGQPPTPFPHQPLLQPQLDNLPARHANGQPQLSSSPNRQPGGKQNGVKLVCDIDQVFPVPEVSIYRLAKLDGSHPDKLAKLDTRIERNPLSGLYHVQVISILDDDELHMKYGLNEPVYFECLIALTNLELSRYSDNKRSIVYRPGLLTNSPLGAQTSEDINLEQAGNSAATSTKSSHHRVLLSSIMVLMSWSVCIASWTWIGSMGLL